MDTIALLNGSKYHTNVEKTYNSRIKLETGDSCQCAFIMHALSAESVIVILSKKHTRLYFCYGCLCIHVVVNIHNLYIVSLINKLTL
jgi:hypothetical protein